MTGEKVGTPAVGASTPPLPVNLAGISDAALNLSEPRFLLFKLGIIVPALIYSEGMGGHPVRLEGKPPGD